jgi:aerobic-type carbon monoxide dehydrogenase small subunit (CoxS/CutS family)
VHHHGLFTKQEKRMSSKQPKTGVSRRGFLKGLSGSLAGAAAVSATLTSRDVSAQAKGALVRGPQPVPLTFTINGTKHTVIVEPRVTLLDALRDHLGFTGHKRVCNRGECGACTVLLNGKTVLACSMLAIEADQGIIETVEGLAKGQELHPVQKAFMANDALQCGFCTSGFIVSCVSLLRENPDPTLAEIKSGISGNICRCGTYPHIFAAVQEAAEAMRKGGKS